MRLHCVIGRTLVLACSVLAAAQTAPTNQKPPAAKPAAKPVAQTAPEAAKPAATTPSVAVVLPADAVVATINGICPQGTPPPCAKTITRAEFDRIIATMNPGLPVSARRDLAANYIQLLLLANEGAKAGLDKEATFEERMRLQRLDLLAQQAVRRMQESYKPSEQEVETYYAENAGKFEELQLRLIVVPKNAGDGMKPEERKPYAEKVRERAAAGEDPDKLESEIFLTLKTPGAPPKTDIGWKRRGTLPRQFESQLANMKAGQVTNVVDDPQSLFVLKIESKRMAPLQAEHDNISKALADQRADETMQKLMATIKAELNEAYFGPAPKAAQPEGPARSERPQEQPAANPGPK